MSNKIAQNMIAFFAVVTLGVCGCSNTPSTGVTPHPKITEAIIEKNIVGKGLGGGLFDWQFAKDEPRESKIIEAKYSGDQATVTIDMKTASSSGRTKMAGRLRLSWEWIAGEWNLVGIENLTFKEQ